MPAILRTLGQLSLLLTVCVTVCHCQETAPQAAGPEWKVPVANFDEAFAKAKFYFERPEHDAAEFYLRECLRYGIPKAKHDVTDAMCTCMLAVVRAQQGYGFEATTSLFEVADRCKDSEDYVECLDIVMDAARRAGEARLKKALGPEYPKVDPPWMVKVSSYEEARARERQYDRQDLRDGAAMEYFLRKCFTFGRLPDEDDYWCRLQLSLALSFQGPRLEKACEAYALALQTYKLYREPKAIPIVIAALISCGDLVKAREYLSFMDRTYPLKEDCFERGADVANREFLSTQTTDYTCEVQWNKLAQVWLPWGRPSELLFPLPQELPGTKLLSYKLDGAASFSEEVDTYYGNRFLRVKLSEGQGIRFQATIRQSPYSIFDRLRKTQGGEWAVPTDVSGKYLGRSYLRGGPELTIDPEGACAGPLVRQLKGPTPADSLLNVYLWARETFFRRMALPPHDISSEWCIENKSWHCEGGSRVAVALLRGCGIPAWTVRGRGMGNPWGTTSGVCAQHTVPGFYIGGVGEMYTDSPPWYVPRFFIPRFRYGGHQEDSGHIWIRGPKGWPPGLAFIDPLFCDGEWHLRDRRIEESEPK